MDRESTSLYRFLVDMQDWCWVYLFGMITPSEVGGHQVKDIIAWLMMPLDWRWRMRCVPLRESSRWLSAALLKTDDPMNTSSRQKCQLEVTIQHAFSNGYYCNLTDKPLQSRIDNRTLSLSSSLIALFSIHIDNDSFKHML